MRGNLVVCTCPGTDQSFGAFVDTRNRVRFSRQLNNGDNRYSRKLDKFLSSVRTQQAAALAASSGTAGTVDCGITATGTTSNWKTVMKKTVEVATQLVQKPDPKECDERTTLKEKHPGFVYNSIDNFIASKCYQDIFFIVFENGLYTAPSFSYRIHPATSLELEDESPGLREHFSQTTKLLKPSKDIVGLKIPKDIEAAKADFSGKDGHV